MMDMFTIAERVQAGSVWLDEHYPGWFKVINLGTLNVSNCHVCVLGQVYSGYIPTHEQDQILAQVLELMSPFEARTFAESIRAGQSGGFNVLYEKHYMFDFASRFGFSMDWRAALADGSAQHAMQVQYQDLTDEWTKVIISRRMAEHRAELVAA